MYLESKSEFWLVQSLSANILQFYNTQNVNACKLFEDCQERECTSH